MPSKLGRNDLCPCGSGRKYKKCCQRWGPDEMERNPYAMLEEVSDWILGQAELRDEFDEVLSLYEPVDGDLSERLLAAVLDAFIFDHELPDGGTPYERYLENAPIAPSDRAAFETFARNVFSVFEVREVFTGDGIVVSDMLRGGDCFVRERLGSLQLETGNVVFCRLAAFKSCYFIISPASDAWPPEMGYSIKRYLRDTGSDDDDRKIGAFDILDMTLELEDRPTDLNSLKRALKRRLRDVGIQIDFRSLGRRINTNDSPFDAFPEIFEHDYSSQEELKDIIDLVHALWNKHPRKEFHGKSPEEMSSIGPRENSLILDLMEETKNAVDPDEHPSLEEAQLACDAFRDSWLLTPQEELDGKTPMEVIREERIELGNKRQGFSYRIQIEQFGGTDSSRAERLYEEGLETFRKGATARSAELFEEVTELYPEHYKAWSNLGCCYAYLGHKDEAMKCYERALEIKPDYDFPKRNMESIRDASEEGLAAMGVLGAIRGLLDDFGDPDRKSTGNVWDEVYRTIEEGEKRKAKKRKDRTSLYGRLEKRFHPTVPRYTTIIHTRQNAAPLLPLK